MLGVQRPGITVALGALVSVVLITTHRSSISIVDRKALEKRANGTYVPVEKDCWQGTITSGRPLHHRSSTA